MSAAVTLRSSATTAASVCVVTYSASSASICSRVAHGAPITVTSEKFQVVPGVGGALDGVAPGESANLIAPFAR